MNSWKQSIHPKHGDGSQLSSPKASPRKSIVSCPDLSWNAEDKIRYHLEEAVGSEIESLFAQLSADLGQELKENRLLASLVETKLSSFDLLHLEQLVLKVAKNELRYIEIFGAVIGLVIGLVQVLSGGLLKKNPRRKHLPRRESTCLFLDENLCNMIACPLFNDSYTYMGVTGM